MAQSIAVLGTGSDVGKTTIVAGLCRILQRNSFKVAPFKAQNMSNNAAPALISPPPPTNGDTPHHHSSPSPPPPLWGEIGTAQALQSLACRLPPRVEMNPILLKSGGRRPDGTYLCSVIVLGRPYTICDYGTLGTRTPEILTLVAAAHASLIRATNATHVVIEGAGSCTELNLLSRDVVNLPLVRRLDCPWILVADIDKGGVFAQIVGTMHCVSEEDWERCRGVVVNRLRGDERYFEPGPDILRRMVGKDVYVVPWLEELKNLPGEDGMDVERKVRWSEKRSGGCGDGRKEGEFVVAIVCYPHISITSDFTLLEQMTTCLWLREPPPRIDDVDAVILPGSKITRVDMTWMERVGWYDWIKKFADAKKPVLGICGGYQMLGRRVDDYEGVESDAGSSDGLHLLPVATSIFPSRDKVVTPRSGVLSFDKSTACEGFELHCGRTTVDDGYPSLITCGDDDDSPEGCVVDNVAGTYLHGILNSFEVARRLLSIPDDVIKNESAIDPLDKLADHLEDCGLDVDTILNMMNTSDERT